MELRMYRYRLYPSRKQRGRLLHSFEACRQAYNGLLEASIKAYKETGKGLYRYDFNKMLKGWKAGVHSQVLQNVSDRLQKAYENFFRRLKDPSCKNKGFPRFKSRVVSITYPQNGFKLVGDKRLSVSKIGGISIVLHRSLLGKVKTLTIKRNRAGQWFAVFSCLSPESPEGDEHPAGCEVDAPLQGHPNKDKSIGIDVGIECFATLSDGRQIANPRHLLRAEKGLKKLQRGLSRKRKGGRNRAKARLLVARKHIGVANQRADFQHKLSKSLTGQYGMIAVEDLNIQGMLRNHCLAKHIADASWNSFTRMLSYKAVASGGQLIKVDPRGTSTTCNGCGAIVEMPLSKREFQCPSCALACHRDLNASLNILGRAGLARTHTPADIVPLFSPSSTQERKGKISSVEEAGTIRLGTGAGSPRL